MLTGQLLAGLIAGLGYALAAVGVALIFGVMRIVNFAQGEFYMLGAMSLLVAGSWGAPTWLAILFAMAVTGLLGALIFRVFVRPVSHDELGGLMVTFGVSLFLINGALLWRGATPEPLPRLIQGNVEVFGASTSKQLILAGAVSLIAIFAVAVFLTRTGAGLRIKAAADNRIGADVSGVRIDRTMMLTFALGVALAALAGALLGPESFFTHDIGHATLAKSFAIVVLGGLGSISGALWASLLLGVLESLVIGYLPDGWQDGTSYLLLVTVILFVLFRVELTLGLSRLRHLQRAKSEVPQGVTA